MDQAREFRLLNDYQRNLPLVAKPYEWMARETGVTEGELLAALRRLTESGEVGRVGAVFAPGCLGTGTLAAMAVPAARLEEVAALVNRHPAVNHNYAREHEFNVWFVATAASREDLATVLDAIAAESGIVPVSLPLVEEYHIDLGFDLTGGTRVTTLRERPVRRVDDVREQALAGALAEGLELIPRPYAALADRAGMDEAECIARLKGWIDEGVVRRLGVIVRHRELGFVANAMAVWDVPDDEVAALGRHLAGLHGVNLCYRRARHLPQWRYNLFCMLHGRERATVRGRFEEICELPGLRAAPHALLFSNRRFKQTGARYLPQAVSPVENAHG